MNITISLPFFFSISTSNIIERFAIAIYSIGFPCASYVWAPECDCIHFGVDTFCDDKKSEISTNALPWIWRELNILSDASMDIYLFIHLLFRQWIHLVNMDCVVHKLINFYKFPFEELRQKLSMHKNGDPIMQYLLEISFEWSFAIHWLLIEIDFELELNFLLHSLEFSLCCSTAFGFCCNK